MPAIEHASLPAVPMRGSSYQTLVGDEAGSAPVFVGLQTCPPGYKTALHSHPYLEIITVLEGKGEAWLEDTEGLVALRPGVSLVLPQGVRHWFSATGQAPMKVMGMHASPQRTVIVHE